MKEKTSHTNLQGFRIGGLVDYHEIIGGPVTSTGHRITHLETWSGRGNTEIYVAFLQDKRGCVSIDSITHTPLYSIDIPEPEQKNPPSEPFTREDFDAHFDLETSYDSQLTCPYCGWQDKDSWERSDEPQEVECEKCQKTFWYETETYKEFFSFKMKEKKMQFSKMDEGKTLVILIEGGSSSLQNEENTLSAPFLKIAMESQRWRDGRVDYNELQPYGRMGSRICAILKMHPPKRYEALLLIGKSKGAVEIHTWVRNYLYRVLEYKRRCIVTIDPHAPFGLCGKKTPINAAIYAPLIPCFNVYQRSHWPEGAEVLGATNWAINGEEVDHFNIIRKPMALRAYLEGCYKTNIKRLV